MNRAALIAEIRATLPAVLDEGQGACLYYAHATAEVLWRAGLRPVIQAGSMQWPIVARSADDGQRNTHFAYMWNADSPVNRLAFAAGILPEMHVWIGLVDTQEIIDFTTGGFRACAEAAGLSWDGPDPPDYLWCATNELPDWVVYRPDRQATLLAAGLLWRMFRPDCLTPGATEPAGGRQTTAGQSLQNRKKTDMRHTPTFCASKAEGNP